MSTVIEVDNLGKLYRLGEVGTGTLSHDLKRWWARTRGKDDPFARVGTLNDRTQKAEKGEYVWALRDINFKIHQGDVVGVIGKNGAGKSTLLKILSRITAPSVGEVKLKGRIGSLLEVGTGFHPEMTGRENVYMNGTVLGMRRYEIDQKFDEIVDFAGVAKYVDTPVKRYSSGMMVRLGFAVAAFLEPEILIVDEVLAVGDADFQKQAIGKMQDVSKGEGRTVLFVSHNMASIQNLCHTGLLLSKGTVVKSGPIEEVTAHYLSEYLEGQMKDDIGSRKDRKGSGTLTFQRAWFENDQGKIIDSLFSGMTCYMNIEVKNHTRELLSNITIAVGIDDSNARRLTVLNNELTNQKIIVGPNESVVVKIKIDSLPLQSDTFYYTLFSSIGGDISDWLTNAGKFFVDSGDYFKTGRVIQKGQGSILIDHEFIS
jgi:lipopolysaccharide transport system ATP-binding protein